MRLVRLYALSVLTGLGACRPAPTSSPASLDNFAKADADKVVNQCSGNFALSASLRIYVEPGWDGLMDGLIAAVAAVPPAIQEVFFATDGGAIVATAAEARACAKPAGGSSAENQFASEGKEVPLACLNANETRRKATIFVQPDAKAAKHAVVRMFGLLYAHVYGPKKYANWRQASEHLTNEFLADVAGNPRLSIKPYESQLGTRGGYATFVDFVFAEAFDSYYCNSATRLRFSTTFPRTFAAFAKLKRVWEPEASVAFRLSDGAGFDDASGEASQPAAEDLPPSEVVAEGAGGGSDYWSSVSSLEKDQVGPSPGVFDDPAGRELPASVVDGADALRPADAGDAQKAREIAAAAPVGAAKTPTSDDVNATPPSEEDLARLANADLLTRGIRSPDEYKRVAKAFGDDVARQVQWETDSKNIPQMPDNASERVRAVIDMYGFTAAGTKGAKALGEKTVDTLKGAADQAAVEGAKSQLSDNGDVVVDFVADVSTVAGDVGTVASSPHLAPLVLAANSLEAQKQKREALEKILGPGRNALESQGKDIVAQTLADPSAGRAALDKAVRANPYDTGYLRAQYWRAYLARNGGKN